MSKLICPHCKKQQSEPRMVNTCRPGDFFWCIFCGELSLVVRSFTVTLSYRSGWFWEKTKRLRKPSKRQLRKIYSLENEDKRLNSPNWLPGISKDRIHFEIGVVEDGDWNSEACPHIGFYETERCLTHLYHATGIFPQVGDEIRGEVRRKPGENKPYQEEQFIIVSRAFFVNDYDEVLLSVVPYEKYMEKMGW